MRNRQLIIGAAAAIALVIVAVVAVIAIGGDDSNDAVNRACVFVSNMDPENVDTATVRDFVFVEDITFEGRMGAIAMLFEDGDIGGVRNAQAAILEQDCS